MATRQASTVTLPLTFGAAARYVWGAAGATALGALTAGYVMPHARIPGVVLWTLTGLYMLLAALMLSLRVRLSADMIRDQALFVSGLLVERVGGPSVKPYPSIASIVNTRTT